MIMRFALMRARALFVFHLQMNTLNKTWDRSNWENSGRYVIAYILNDGCTL